VIVLIASRQTTAIGPVARRRARRLVAERDLRGFPYRRPQGSPHARRSPALRRRLRRRSCQRRPARRRPRRRRALRRYDRALRATVHALWLPNGVDAHDVLQAARLGFTDAIAAWRPGGAPFRVFARTCARRDAISAIDKARAAQRRVLADAVSLEDLALAGREPTSDDYAPAVGCDPLRTVLAREQLDAIIAVVPTLGRCEAACLKGWLNGCTYTELARSLGGTRKTVECSVRRARRKITTALERT